MAGMKKKGIYLIMSLTFLMGTTACENELGVSPSHPEERQVTVSLSLGLPMKKTDIPQPEERTRAAETPRKAVHFPHSLCRRFVQGGMAA